MVLTMRWRIDMREFKKLYSQIDQTQSTNEKTALIRNYFLQTPSEDAAWALFFLTGERIRRLVSSADLSRWCKEYLQIPDWLYDESFAAVGDTAETISLLLNHQEGDDVNLTLSQLMEQHLLPLQNKTEEEKKQIIQTFWQKLDRKSCYIFNKLLTGGFRVGVSKLITTKALALALDVPRERLVQAINQIQRPSKKTFDELRELKSTAPSSAHPYPFYLASPLEKELDSLGDSSQWLAEWKWDGIRAQLIFHDTAVYVWSRGNEMITEQCPDLIHEVKSWKNSIILDGEILAYRSGKPLPFFALQKRLGRKKPSLKIQEEIPLSFMAYDMLSWNEKDYRQFPLQERRDLLVQFVHELKSSKILLSPALDFKSWEELKILQQTAKDYAAEGVMLKERTSPYLSGRVKGAWWKFKVDPMTIDAVLLYAQPGSGYRANLYTDYTFAVWNEGELVPIAKAYSGLSNIEIEELDRWIRRHTVEKFGPVRQVEPFQVFEIAFESVQPSSRHKSSLALRFPRILRWRKDKTADQADQLSEVKKFLPEQ